VPEDDATTPLELVLTPEAPLEVVLSAGAQSGPRQRPARQS